MTLRLYYSDSYLKQFSAVVLDKMAFEGRPAVILDQTAFYPTSGGQPHDTGRLGNARVIDVQDQGDAILHLIDGEIPAGPVGAEIDWTRRFDHMQQHSGQHVLSQAFIQTCAASTLSFHLGQETSTIDIGLSQPEDSIIETAEQLASQIVFEDRAVQVVTATREGLGELGLRKPTEREGEIRIIEIESFDRSACGGTHVGRTGEIGLISILGYERYKGGTRVEFVCGGRALRAFRRDHALLKELSNLFSAHPDELPRLSQKAIQDRSALAKENEHWRKQVLEMEAAELCSHSEVTEKGDIVTKIYESRQPDELKFLAQRISARPKSIAILGLAQNPAQVFVAKSPDVPGSCGNAIKETIAALGGRGGGKPELAQAGGFPLESLEAWIAALRQHFLK